EGWPLVHPTQGRGTMNDTVLKAEIDRVKKGAVRNFGFVKAKQGKKHGLAVAPKPISGPLLLELADETGNNTKPIFGHLRYDPTEKKFILETKATPSSLLSPLKEMVQARHLPMPEIDVRHNEKLDEKRDFSPPKDGTGDGSAPPDGDPRAQGL